MLCAFPLADLRSEGFAVSGLAKYLATDEGVEQFMKTGLRLIIPPQSACFVPWGMLTWPLVLDPEMNGDHLFLQILPILSKQLTLDIQLDSWTQVTKTMDTVMKSEKATDSFRAHAETWAKFTTLVGRKG